MSLENFKSLKIQAKKREIWDKGPSPSIQALLDKASLYTDTDENVFTEFRKQDEAFECAFASPVVVDSADITTLLYVTRQRWEKEKNTTIFNELHRSVVQSIAGPFGLGSVLAAYDKTGGNVDTIHNARQQVNPEDGSPVSGIYATDKERDARIKHDSETYDSSKYHSNTAYRDTNKTYSEAFEHGELYDGNTGEKMDRKHDLDHVISAHEIDRDSSVVLAELDPVSLACRDTNLVPTDPSINRSKKNKSVNEYCDKWEKNQLQRQRKIEEFNSKKDSLTEKERKKLRKLEAMERLNPEKMRALDKKARDAYNAEINKTYYTSKKFIKNTVYAGVQSGMKMGMQQALGLFLLNLYEALFKEVLDIMEKGFLDGTAGKHENTKNFSVNKPGFVNSLITRLKRVGLAVIACWKEVVISFRDGAVSGFLSDLLTTLINGFGTTAKRFVRIIREGFMALFNAVKLLLLRPATMSISQAADASLKLLCGGTVVAGGILLEDFFHNMLKGTTVFAPFAGPLSAVIVGISVGITTSLIVFGLDKLDFFGVQMEKQQDFVIETLTAERKVLAAATEERFHELGIC